MAVAWSFPPGYWWLCVLVWEGVTAHTETTSQISHVRSFSQRTRMREGETGRKTKTECESFELLKSVIWADETTAGQTERCLPLGLATVSIICVCLCSAFLSHLINNLWVIQRMKFFFPVHSHFFFVSQNQALKIQIVLGTRDTMRGFCIQHLFHLWFSSTLHLLLFQAEQQGDSLRDASWGAHRRSTSHGGHQYCRAEEPGGQVQLHGWSHHPQNWARLEYRQVW